MLCLCTWCVYVSFFVCVSFFEWMTGVCSVRKRVYTSLMPSVDLTPDATWIKLVFLFSFVIFASFQSYRAFSMEYSLVFIVLYFSLSPPCLRYVRFFFFFWNIPNHIPCSFSSHQMFGLCLQSARRPCLHSWATDWNAATQPEKQKQTNIVLYNNQR